ncbi:MAG: ATP-binding protein [Bacteroidales bacterium]|nr:ATP-binding protein [Bacteroidales bacterium]
MKLEIKNFGPIKEGKIETKKVTVLIGNQGSGKSTVAKLLATFCWIEKDVFRRGYSEEIESEIKKRFNAFWDYHRLSNYLKGVSHITYAGPVLKIDFKNWVDGNSTVKPINNVKYSLPKITYFPAERNFLSSIKKSKQGQDFTLWTQSLQEFKEIFQDAKDNMKGTLRLPINDIDVEYDNFKEVLYVKGKDYKIPLSESASGFQSFVPMFVVADYLSKMLQSEYEMSSSERDMFKKESAEILNNPIFTDEQKRMLLSNLAKKINVSRTINIIEEPEQNLFPTSQRSMLNSLLEFNNAVSGNRLILTTHSPYILSYLMLVIQAAEIKEKAKGNPEILSKLYEIVPEKAITPMKDVVVYELNDDGTISELPQSYGLPSNDNFLNNELGKTNTLFSELMDIEDLCDE